MISYASRLLSKAESNYSVTERECLALIFAVQRFRSYIWGAKIKVITDHHALCWLMKKKDLAGRLARWSLQLQDLDIEIVYRSGKLHSDADVLSRNPVDRPEPTDEIPTLMLLTTNDEGNFKRDQENSLWWKPILQGLRSKENSASTRRLRNKYSLRDGLLFRRVIWDGHEHFRLCVPEGRTEEILMACHDDVTAGHLGVTRSLDKIQNVFSGRGLLSRSSATCVLVLIAKLKNVRRKDGREC